MIKNSTDRWLLWTTLAFVASFWCLALIGCAKPMYPPLPPTSIPYCRTVVVVTQEDLCGMITHSAPFYQCVKCQGGSACVARDIGVYCVSGGCDDPVCSSDGKPR